VLRSSERGKLFKGASLSMTLDTEKTIYIGLDAHNSEVKVLTPRNFPFQVVELYLSDPDPRNTDPAEFELLSQEMDSVTYQI
jgi:hypothetical protein